MAPRTALLLALAACLAAAATAELPTLENPGGPPFLEGAVFNWNATAAETVSLGLVANNSFSVSGVDEGGLFSVFGRYLSWQCGDEPGTYTTVLEFSFLSNVPGKSHGPKQVCQFGRISLNDMVSIWGQSETECPSATTNVDLIFDRRPLETAVCGEAPDLLANITLPDAANDTAGMGARKLLAAAPFANPGGPLFLDGPSYDLSPDQNDVVGMGLTHESDYSFAAQDPAEGLITERGTYTSWECVADKPGYYRAAVNITVYNADGKVVDTKEACEFGYVDDNNKLNGWAQAEGECPTETTDELHFFRFRENKNTCGTFTAPADSDAVGDLIGDLQDNLAPTPAP